MQLQIKLHGNLRDFTGDTDHYELQLSVANSAKDIIESLGPPHTECAYACFNGTAIALESIIHTDGELSVYGHDCLPTHTRKAYLLANHPAELRFLLDVHLGELARQLRLLGFDTVYSNQDPGDQALAQQAAQQQRILLSRDIGIFKRKILSYGYWLRNRHPQKQLMELFQRYPLAPQINTFSRCLRCNGKIKSVNKADIAACLPEHVYRHQQQFWQCSDCKKVYWKGSHYQKLEQHLQQLML